MAGHFGGNWGVMSRRHLQGPGVYLDATGPINVKRAREEEGSY